MTALLWYTPICFLFYIGLEKIFPSRVLPNVPGWTRRVLLVTFGQTVLTVLIGLFWEAHLLGASMLKLTNFVHPLAGGLLAYVLSTFIYYWWHRWRHQSPFLWRTLHQMHHSPARLEVVTALYKHPLEAAVGTIIGSLLIYTILGLPLEAPIYYGLFSTAAQFFLHMNVRTPYWVGYVVQRPEMHRVHHQYGRHASNFGEIVWWDMLFGTYCNPVEAPARCGFEPEQEQRFWAMMWGREVSSGSGFRVPGSGKLKTRNSPQHGFNLVELFILLAIVSMIAAVSLPMLLGARRSANGASAQQTLRNLHSAQETYAQGVGLGNYTPDLTKLGSRPGGIGLLDETVVNAQKTPKSGFLLSPITVVRQRTDNRNKVFQQAGFWVRNVPVKSTGITRTGNDCYFVDETGVIRHSSAATVLPDANSDSLQ